MSVIKDNISDACKQAMRDKSKDRLASLRLIQAAFKQKEVDERITLDDNAVIDILRKMVKQGNESIKHYKQANREDLLEKEQFELDIIQEFLPQGPSIEQINKTIATAIASSGASSIKDMGKVMAEVKKQLGSTADMNQVSQLVKQELSK